MTHNAGKTFSVRKHQHHEQLRWELITGDGCPVEQAERFIHTLLLRGLSPRTRRTYAYDLLAAYRWMAEANRKPEQLTGDDLVEFIDYLQRPPPASPSTINRRLRLLQRFVEFLTGDAPVSASCHSLKLWLTPYAFMGSWNDRPRFHKPYSSCSKGDGVASR